MTPGKRKRALADCVKSRSLSGPGHAGAFQPASGCIARGRAERVRFPVTSLWKLRVSCVGIYWTEGQSWDICTFEVGAKKGQSRDDIICACPNWRFGQSRTAGKIQRRDLRHSFQSWSVTSSISFAALCSHLPLRFAKSFFTAGIARGDPKCMFAISRPIEYKSRSSSRSFGSVDSSMREQSGANRRTSQRSLKLTNGSFTRIALFTSCGPKISLSLTPLAQTHADGRIAFASRAMYEPRVFVRARIRGWPRLPRPATRDFNWYSGVGEGSAASINLRVSAGNSPL